MSDAKNLLERIKAIPSSVCSSCRHAETVDSILVDGESYHLYCSNLEMYASPFTRCGDWEAKP